MNNLDQITFNLKDDTVTLSKKKNAHGKVICPSSKSAAHRELIAAALADKDSTIICRGMSKDIEATVECLTALGANIKKDGETITVSPIDTSNTANKKATLNCNESGTTLRFMIPLAAFLGVDATFVCAESLTKRPISILCDELSRHGVSFPNGYTFPLKMHGKAEGGDFSICGSVSSQFISGILLALPLSNKPSTLKIIGKCESLPYIDITRSVMSSHGINVAFSEDTYSVSPAAYKAYQKATTVEADWSSAGFWLAAGLSSDDGISSVGQRLSSSQGDKAIFDILKNAGADIAIKDDVVTVKKSRINAFECDCSQTPDMVPILSICAAAANGTSKIHGVERLRLKESDRIESTIALLSNIGISASYNDGTITICGGNIHGGNVCGYNDHRIVMSAAVASLFTSEPITITDAHAVSKSYPAFFEHLSQLLKNTPGEE